MKILIKVKLFSLIYMCGVSFLAQNQLFSSVNESEMESIFYVDSSDSFINVVEYAENYLNGQGLDGNGVALEPTTRELSLDLIICDAGITVKPLRKAGAIEKRNYYANVTSQQKKDIRYIITTLANDSLASIATSKSSLKKAGNRIDNVHPLKFLMSILKDEELKAGLHAIRDRSWIWDEFSGGLVGSLRDEMANHNMKPEFINDFTNNLQINEATILPAIQQSRWKDFINILIDTVPRTNNPNRYDM